MAEYTSYANNPLSSSACNPEPGNNGNIAYIADTVNVGWAQSFNYDGLNRLLTAARSDGGYNHTYNYDSFGNLVVQDNLNTNPTFTVNAATNQLNRWNGPVNLYTYDAAGNITSTGTSDIGGHTFNYNPLSQITSVDGNMSGSYTYNGLDERVYTQTGSISTNYIYFNSQPMSEWVSTGVWTDYIYAEGQKIAKIMTPATPAGGASTLNYYLDDHLGTTQVELDASGNVTWQGQFTPFGAELPDGATTMHYKFTGKERDAESGLDYFPARYLGSSMGRWMSPDPLPWLGWQHPSDDASEEEKEEAHQKFEDWIGNPQNLNLYAYVNNNPLSHTDPTGMAGCQAGDKKFTTCTITVTYDPKTSKGTLTVTGMNKGDKEATTLLTSSVVVGGDGHVTPTGTFTAQSWEKDHVSTKYGTWADTKYSDTKLGLNAFGPYQLHIKELDSRGIYIHGTMGPSWNPFTTLNSLVSPTSHGCIRMCNRDDNALHTLMPSPAGNKIIIKTGPQ